MSASGALPEDDQSGRPGARGPAGGGAEPPDHASMERRVSTLEGRLDTVLPTLATKTDIAELRTEFTAQFGALRTEFAAKFGALRTEFTAQFGALRTELHVETGKVAAQVTDLRTETRVGFETLRTEMRVENEKLRTEMRVENEKLRAEMRVENEKLRAEMQVQGEQLRTEMKNMSLSMMKWMVATVIGMFLGFAGLFLAMSNILTAELPAPTQAMLAAPPPPLPASPRIP